MRTLDDPAMVSVPEHCLLLLPSHGSGIEANSIWSKSVILTMLTNELYIGRVIFGRTKSAPKGGEAEKRAVEKNADAWTVTELPAHLRILDAELWKRVQARRATTTAYTRNADGTLQSKPESGLTSRFLLSGIAKCGVCGASIVYQSKGRVKRKPRYYCQRHLTGGVCPNDRGIPLAELDALIRSELSRLCNDEEKAAALIDECRASYEREAVAHGDERANTEREAQKLAAAVERLADAIEAGQPVGDRLKLRTAELDALRAKLSEPVTLAVNKREVVEGLRRSGLMVLADAPSARQGLRKLGVSITVKPAEGGWRVQIVSDFGKLASVATLGGPGDVPLPPIAPHRIPSPSRVSIVAPAKRARGMVMPDVLLTRRENRFGGRGVRS